MAHELDTSKGFAAIAYNGELPWHRRGNYEDPQRPGETGEEFVKRWAKSAGVDYPVIHSPVCLPDGTVIPGRVAVMRADTGKVFTVATTRRKDPQPVEIVDFFADRTGLDMETAGALKDGAIVWGMAKTNRDFIIRGEDKVKTRLLLATSYDGSMATSAYWTSVRTVCRNTLRMAIGAAAGAAVRMRHTQIFDTTAIDAQLGLLDESADDFERAANLLAERKVTESEIENIIMSLFASYKPQTADEVKAGAAPVLTTQSQNVMQAVVESMATGPGAELSTARGTAWGVLNGITHYVDHAARAHNDDNRLHSAWFGKGDALKADAFKLVRELVPVLAA